jgi:hypothetical protein
MLESLIAVIFAAAAGSTALAAPQPVCTSGITVGTISVNNSATALVDDSMTLQVPVTSACQIQSVVAEAFGHSSALSFNASQGWTGSFSLAGDPTSTGPPPAAPGTSSTIHGRW